VQFEELAPRVGNATDFGESEFKAGLVAAKFLVPRVKGTITTSKSVPRSFAWTTPQIAIAALILEKTRLQRMEEQEYKRSADHYAASPPNAH